MRDIAPTPPGRADARGAAAGAPRPGLLAPGSRGHPSRRRVKARRFGRWAAEHDVPLGNWQDAAAGLSPAGRTTLASSPITVQGDLAHVRAVAHRAIDRMGMADLLRLPLPLEALLDQAR